MKKIVFGVVSCVSLLGVAFPASAQVPQPTGNWVSVTKGDDNSLFQLDRGITRKGPAVGFWMQNWKPDGTRHAWYVVAHCQNKLYQNVKTLRLNTSGQVVASSDIKSNITQARYGYSMMTVIDTACGNVASDPNAAIVQTQLEMLQRARETNAEMINNAFNAAVEMFK
ncbi:hypothetical protein F7734_53530 [Scytonema sp. UIC 10036]|uniref:hypothetical protein n=1 Tax=Scytonema sp. UIC 10036 TaxID=2304196 RepID=UPI0012DAAD50|nr:hypothetical protein [Scytonema sp. UIC 10036]MUH00630.1 hypothetical protein [Scytonema sp. UIC 10036]